MLDSFYTRTYVWVRDRAHEFLNLPAWILVLAIYSASRLWDFAVFSAVGKQQLAGPWGGPLGYQDFISTWDAGWYEQIARTGYPDVLPVDYSGAVMENPWAFYPVFPYLADTLSRVTGLSYYPAASLVALGSGFVAAVVIYYLFESSVLLLSHAREHSAKSSKEPSTEKKIQSAREESAQHARTLALWGVALVAFLPIAPVLQVPYAEATGLLFLAATLLALVRGAYGRAVLWAIIACLSRPIGVPLGAAAGLWWALSLWLKLRANARVETAQRKKTGAVIASSLPQLLSALGICAAALLWPAIAWIRTGRVDAYTATETAWRGKHLAPFEPWIHQSRAYLGEWGLPLLIALVIGYAIWSFSPVVRSVLHPVLNLFAGCYVLYLLIFLNPQSSTFRLLLPLFVMALPVMALSASRAYRMALVLFGAAAGAGWVGWLWHWKQLPTGGDYPP
ncbi:MAG: hypothetical protein Q4P78_02675 [Rothia sp. (in: high G+C Gram-positive bacteria)]|uniref:hypothetical protein n=1 Tax=Rothia sp. (in: high G+C Gram-positive bacteria) TaxID=1885016 RepID=UPI0026DF78B3|nr:hypothetical protein [Rothia sp. (in: high G+C Gram-positive bacteria)]MDO5750093.1 hypothetical protein [Rothia sp. (in: high G+C Gram-positive bacteria)]